MAEGGEEGYWWCCEDDWGLKVHEAHMCVLVTVGAQKVDEKDVHHNNSNSAKKHRVSTTTMM